MGGEVGAVIVSMADAIPQVKAGNVVPVATSGTEAKEVFPDLPEFNQSHYIRALRAARRRHGCNGTTHCHRDDSRLRARQASCCHGESCASRGTDGRFHARHAPDQSRLKPTWRRLLADCCGSEARCSVPRLQLANRPLKPSTPESCLSTGARASHSLLSANGSPGTSHNRSHP